MEKEKGKVTSVSQKPGRYGIALGKDNWFNGKGNCPCKKDDEVEIAYNVNGTFKNIETVYGGKPATEEEKVSEEAPMEKMNKRNNNTNTRVCALNNATILCIAKKETKTEQVLDCAKTMIVQFLEE